MFLNCSTSYNKLVLHIHSKNDLSLNWIKREINGTCWDIDFMIYYISFLQKY